MKQLAAAVIIVLLNLQSLSAQFFDGSKIGNGLRFAPADSSFTTQFNVRFQNLYIGNYDLNSSEYNDRMLIRRFRLKFKGYLVDPKIEYKIELALSNRDQADFLEEQNSAASIVLDAVLKYKFAPGWQFWIGQTKLPGNRERVISSGAMQFTDRSRLNSRYNIDRDKGIQLHHEHRLGDMTLRQVGSISLGEGRNITEENHGGYNYTGRAEFLPFGKFTKKGDYFGGDLIREPSPKLSIGITYDYNDGTNRSRGQLGEFLGSSSDLSTWFVDLMFKYKGFSIMSEFAYKRVVEGRNFGVNEDGENTFFYTGRALNICTSYNWPSNFEIATRYVRNEPEQFSDFQFNDDRGNAVTAVGNIENWYTLNLSKYIAGHTLKMQVSAEYINVESGNDYMLFMGMLEIGF